MASDREGHEPGCSCPAPLWGVLPPCRTSVDIAGIPLPEDRRLTGYRITCADGDLVRSDRAIMTPEQHDRLRQLYTGEHPERCFCCACLHEATRRIDEAIEAHGRVLAEHVLGDGPNKGFAERLGKL